MIWVGLVSSFYFRFVVLFCIFVCFDTFYPFSILADNQPSHARNDCVYNAVSWRETCNLGKDFNLRIIVIILIFFLNRQVQTPLIECIVISLTLITKDVIIFETTLICSTLRI